MQIRVWTIRTLPTLVLIGRLGLLAVVGHAQQPTPASAPAGPLQSPERLGQLQALARRLNHRRWGAPVIERFDQPVEKGKDPWKAHGAPLVRKDGRLVVQAKQRALIWAQRRVPDEIVKADGVRVDAWVRMTKAGNPFPRLGLYLGAQNQQPMRWDYTYYFAYTNVRSQRLRLAGRTVRSGVGVQPKADGRLHVVMELVGTQVRCWLNKQQVFSHVDTKSVQIPDQAVVGFTCMGNAIEVIQLSYRPLAPMKGQIDPAEWPKQTPFKSQKELTSFMSREVIPRLSHPSFVVRRQATELIQSLMPLTRPAVKAALRSARDPETRLRLETIQEVGRTLKVDPPSDLKPPPQQEAPATQPDRPAPGPGGAANPRPAAVRIELP